MIPDVFSNIYFCQLFVRKPSSRCQAKHYPFVRVLCLWAAVTNAVLNEIQLMYEHTTPVAEVEQSLSAVVFLHGNAPDQQPATNVHPALVRGIQAALSVRAYIDRIGLPKDKDGIGVLPPQGVIVDFRALEGTPPGEHPNQGSLKVGDTRMEFLHRPDSS